MQLSTPMAKIAPPRPMIDRDGNDLNFRTHISSPSSPYDVYDPTMVTTQVELYRWCRGEDFTKFVSIKDLHQWLYGIEYPDVTKSHQCRTILQALSYDPRKTKGVTKDNPVACAAFYFQNSLELQYGLEWMISLWINAVRPEAIDPKSTSLIFDELATCEDPFGEFIEPMATEEIVSKLPAFTWARLWGKRGWETQGPKAAKLRMRPDQLRSL